MKRGLAALGVSVVLMSGGAASAATIRGEAHITDYAGAFGPAPTNGRPGVFDQAFQLTARFDTALGVRTTDAVSDAINGDVFDGGVPPGSGVLQIGDQTFLVGTTEAVIGTYAGPNFSRLRFGLDAGGDVFSFQVQRDDITVPVDLMSLPATLACHGDGFCSGAGGFSIVDPGGDRTAAEGSFDFSTVEVAYAVPEPETWLVLLLGFAGIGAQLRRRPTTTAVRVG